MDHGQIFAAGYIAGLLSGNLALWLWLWGQVNRRTNPAAAGIGRGYPSGKKGPSAASLPHALSRDSARPGSPPRPVAAGPTYPILITSRKRHARSRTAGPPWL